MFYFITATSPTGTTVYTLTTSTSWHGWTNAVANLSSKPIKPFPNGILTFDNFYRSCIHENTAYSFSYITIDSLERLQNSHPELFI